MASTLTLKNIPDTVYERLKAAAQANRRSLNMQAIVCLESALAHSVHTPGERLTRARALRSGQGHAVSPRDIDAFKREGRP